MDSSPIGRDLFAQNRKRLIEQLPPGSVAVVPANTKLQRNGDVTFRFRQNSNFFYLTGINEPDCLLVLAGEEEWLAIPNRDKTRALWEGQLTTQQFYKMSGVKNIIERSQLERKFVSLVNKSNAIYLTRVNGEAKLGYSINAALIKTEQWVRKKVGRKKIRDIRPVLARQRMIKQPAEIECIKQAIKITKQALIAAQRLIKPGIHEYEVAAKIGQVFLDHNASEAFPSIVATGANACTIHYEKNDGKLKAGEMLLFDVGAEYQNYAADISRTLAIGGKLTRRQSQVYAAVKTVQQQAMAMLKPGINFLDYEKSVRAVMKEQLVKLKLLKPNSPSNAVAKYFPHGTSHFLGLDVHDVGDYGQPLQAGMVLTVEPGIYIPEEGIGMRIEDDVLITSDGTENLSTGIPL